MHAFSILTLGIFVAGYSTARWDLVTRVYELAIFAWDHGVVARAAKGFGLLSVVFVLIILPFTLLAARESELVSRTTTRLWCLRLTGTAPTDCRQWHLCA
jgi:hypothetical protein